MRIELPRRCPSSPRPQRAADLNTAGTTAGRRPPRTRRSARRAPAPDHRTNPWLGPVSRPEPVPRIAVETSSSWLRDPRRHTFQLKRFDARSRSPPSSPTPGVSAGAGARRSVQVSEDTDDGADRQRVLVIVKPTGQPRCTAPAFQHPRRGGAHRAAGRQVRATAGDVQRADPQERRHHSERANLDALRHLRARQISTHKIEETH